MSDDCRHCRNPRRGSRLADGAAHAHDHASWTRRHFLGTLGFAAGGLMVGRFPARALAENSMLARLAGVESDRVLVILQLSGGNDGLNTLVPFRNDIYRTARPDLVIADSIQVSDEIGFHPAMEPLEGMFKDGRMAILHSVGYDESKLSHFSGTDIWMTGGDALHVPDDGWAGRFLDRVLGERLLPYPMAIQLGDGAPLLFKGPSSQMAMSIRSMELFQRLVTTGQLYDTAGLPANELGDVVRFMRSVSNNLIHYAEAVKTAYTSGMNRADYPPDNLLGEQLASIARLIRGGLQTRVYHVTLGGFDTHARQRDTHADLLKQMSEAMAVFYDDLAEDRLDQRVLGMSFSEFGRRVAQNSSLGTDHGAAAPLFLFGPSVEGGFHGTPPDLEDLDDDGNLKFETDYRSVYGTVLQRWFGLDAADAADLLGREFQVVDLV